MADLYPLVFDPVFKERIWGGRRLERFFPDLPAGPIGEAWILSDHLQGPTPVTNGPLKGETLRSLRERFGAELFGTAGLSPKTGEFPLLFKLLDCDEDLSIQVHPEDSYEGLPPGELGKTEMWVVLGADPGAQAVYGLKDGVTPELFAQAVADGRTMDVMRSLTVRAGDVLYVPAGTIHALGKGLLVAEIQQSSDTTYRVYDYDRVGLDGKPRDLHIEHALKVSRYGEPPAPGRLPEPAVNQWAELVRSPYFVVSVGVHAGDWPLKTHRRSFHVLLVIEGEPSIRWSGGEIVLKPGATTLVPAGLGEYELVGASRTLLVTVP